MMLVVIVGFSVLALDGARYMSLQTQLQQGADALALAGAAELDKLPGARDRATAAINNILTNKTLFGTGADVNVRLASGGIRFLNGLPASDATAIDSTYTTTDDALAAFVEVTVEPVSLPAILPATAISRLLGRTGGSDAIATTAQAVAGFPNQVICDMAPVFICNPYETTGMTDDEATAALHTAMDNSTTKRRMLKMDTSRTSPGHFGFLKPTSCPG